MRVLACLMLSFAAAGAFAQTQTNTKSKPATTKATTKATAKKGTASPVPAKTKTVARTGSTRIKGKRARAKPAPTYQLHPDPERYKQIQQALADRGYFKGQVNGEWGDDSVEALKKFQADQKLEDDGKINSLSLIGLGLGPKHDGSSAVAAPMPPPPPPTTEAPPPAAPDEHSSDPEQAQPH